LVFGLAGILSFKDLFCYLPRFGVFLFSRWSFSLQKWQ
jgi:hypothetical protein